jgi:hypothetical protein
MVATAIAAIGVGVGLYGAISGSDAAEQQAAYQAEALKLQKQEMEERRKAMDLDARRRRREIIRQGIAARSAALTTTTAQGANFGSALPGAYGGIEGRTGTNLQGVNQNQEIGGRIFDLKGMQSDAYVKAAMAGSQMATSQALTQAGSMMIQNSSQLATLGKSAYGFLTS